MGLSGLELAIILLVAVLLFGSGKISGLMGDFAKGLRTFKKTLNEPDEPAAPAPSALPEGPKEAGAAYEPPQAEKPQCAPLAGS